MVGIGAVVFHKPVRHACVAIEGHLAAIRAHASNNSEANGVVAAADALNETQMQDLLNFLRSL